MMLMILLWCNDVNGDGDDDDYDVTQLCACRSMRWSRDPCWSRVKAFAHCVPISHDIPLQSSIIISHCILISSQSSRKNGKSKLIFTGSNFHKSFGFPSRPRSRISGKFIFQGIQVPGPPQLQQVSFPSGSAYTSLKAHWTYRNFMMYLVLYVRLLYIN